MRRTNSSQTVALSVGAMLAIAAFAVAEGPQAIMNGWPRVFFDDFESGTLDRWEPSDPNAWKPDVFEGRKVANQFAQSQVETPVRSPFNRSVVKDLVVSDCVVDLQLRTTARDYPHRSLCLFFGYQDPAHMYYVHLGQKADEHANQIFIVDNEPRRKISSKTTEGTPWDDHWHHVRIVRDVKTGSIDVFWDDMEQPVMQAVDKTFTWGQVGIGSFDDSGLFDDVAVYGVKVERSKP